MYLYLIISSLSSLRRILVTATNSCTYIWGGFPALLKITYDAKLSHTHSNLPRLPTKRFALTNFPFSVNHSLSHSLTHSPTQPTGKTQSHRCNSNGKLWSNLRLWPPVVSDHLSSEQRPVFKIPKISKANQYIWNLFWVTTSRKRPRPLLELKVWKVWSTLDNMVL